MAKNRGSGRSNENESNKTAKTAAIVAAIIVVLFIGALIFNSSAFGRNITAVEAAGIKFSAADYSYFNSEAVNSYVNRVYNETPDFASMLLPSANATLSSQIYDTTTGKTWADFFEDLTMSEIHALASIYAESLEVGYTLDAGQEADLAVALEDQILQIELYYGSFNKYIKDAYRNTINRKDFERLYRMRYTAAEYETSKIDAFEYSEEELTAYYEANKNDLDVFRYRVFPVEAEQVDSTQYVDEAEYQAALLRASEEAYAKAIGYASSIRDEADFADKAREVDEFRYANDINTLRLGSGSSAEEPFKSWLIDGARSVGEVTVLAANPERTEDSAPETTYYVTYFVERDDNNYDTANVHQFGVAAETVDETLFTDENGELDVAGYEAALAQAAMDADNKLNEIIADWDGTLDSLIAIAADTENELMDGGFAEEVPRNAQGMSEELNEWLFAARKDGDYLATVDANGNAQIAYFVSHGTNYMEILADNGLLLADYTAWKGTHDRFSIETKWGFRFRLPVEAIG